MGADNRLTADQLAALSPGDVVTIESGLEFGRRRYSTGKVARAVGSHILVMSQGVRGGKFVERYDARDGVRVGAGTRAELVNADPGALDGRAPVRRRARDIEAAYRRWARHRDDVEALRQLQNAVEEYLHEREPAGDG